MARSTSSSSSAVLSDWNVVDAVWMVWDGAEEEVLLLLLPRGNISEPIHQESPPVPFGEVPIKI